MNEKKIVREAVVLLTAALMILPASAVLATTRTHSTAAPQQAGKSIVWDNVMGVHGSRGGIIVATVRTEGIAFPADDFQFNTTVTVDSVAWQGGYFQCQLAQGQKDYHWDWRIIFWNDIGNGSWPGTEIYNRTISDASITRSFWYNYTRPDNNNTYWVANYSCPLPVPQAFNAGTKYWITIQAIQTPNTYPQGAWCRHNSSQSPIKLHEAMFKGVYWLVSNWATIMSVLITGGDPNPLPHDLNFQLIGSEGDTTPPETNCTLEGEMSGGNYTSPVKVTLTAVDLGSGVNYTKYKVDAGEWTTYTGSFNITEEGNHTIAFYSEDNAGNIETEKTATFTIRYPIEITIKGVFGITATVKNVGDVNLTDINWTISCVGGFILKGKSNNGTISALNIGTQTTVRDMPIGFGKTTITVKAGYVEKSAVGLVLLFLVILKK